MNTIIITDVNDMELGVFILFKYREEIKKVIPGISHSIANRSLTDLISGFSLFTLPELIRSILSGLKALCSRNILSEEQLQQNSEQIKFCEEQMAHLLPFKGTAPTLIPASVWRRSLTTTPRF